MVSAIISWHGACRPRGTFRNISTRTNTICKGSMTLCFYVAPLQKPSLHFLLKQSHPPSVKQGINGARPRLAAEGQTKTQQSSVYSVVVSLAPPELRWKHTWQMSKLLNLCWHRCACTESQHFAEIWSEYDMTIVIRKVGRRIQFVYQCETILLFNWWMLYCNLS